MIELYYGLFLRTDIWLWTNFTTQTEYNTRNFHSLCHKKNFTTKTSQVVSICEQCNTMNNARQKKSPSIFCFNEADFHGCKNLMEQSSPNGFYLKCFGDKCFLWHFGPMKVLAIWNIKDSLYSTKIKEINFLMKNAFLHQWRKQNIFQEKIFIMKID